MAQRAFASGFSQGLAQSMTQITPLLLQQRLAETTLEERKREHKLKEQMMALQGQMLEMQLQERVQKMLLGAAVGQQIEGMGATPGQEFERPGEAPGVGPAQVSPRAKLAGMMARGGQTGEALKLMPELTEPPPELAAKQLQATMGALQPALQGLSGAPAGPGAAAQPGAPAPAGPMGGPGLLAPPAPGQAPGPGPQLTFQPTLNVGKNGAISLSIQGQRTNFQLTQFTKDTPDGPQLFERVFDPVGGRVINEYAVGRPAAPQKLEELSQTITNAWGIPRSSPFHGRILGALTLLEGLPPEQRALAIQKLDAEIKTLANRPGGQAGLSAPGVNIMGPTPGMPAPGGIAAAGGLSSPGDIAASAGTAARAQEVTQTEAKTRVTETAKREEGPLLQTTQTRVNFFQDARAQVGNIKQTYDPAFVGKGFEPFLAGAQSQFQKAMAQISTDEAAGKKDAYVPGAMAGALRTYLGTANEKETVFRRSVLDASDLILRARSGAQINEQEASRLQKLLFQVTDSPKVFEAALARFEASINTSIKQTYEGAITSPKEQLRKESGRTEPLGIPAPKPGPKKPVMRVTPDGRWVPVP